MGALIERYKSLSRASRWVVWAVVALASFLVWDTGAVMASEYGERADAAAADIAEYERVLRQRRAGGDRLDRGIERHGPVDWVGSATEREAELADLVSSLVEAHRIPQGWSTSFKTTRLRSAAAERLFAPKRVDRLVCTFTFQASPETMTAVVRSLEGSPIVFGVNALNARVTDRNAQTLSVTLDAETWVWEAGR